MSLIHASHPPGPASTLEARLRLVRKAWFGLVGFLAVITLGSLIGWLFGNTQLLTLFGTSSPISCNSVVMFGLINVSLFLLHGRNRYYRPLAAALAALAAMVGGLTMAEYVSGLNLGIDRLFLPHSPIHGYLEIPGRMSPFSALSFALLGCCLLLYSLDRDRLTTAVHVLAVAVGTISLYTLTGYLYNITVLYTLAAYKPISILSGLGFLLCFFAVLFSRPSAGLMKAVLEESSRGLIIRRFLLMVWVVPILLGGLVHLGTEVGLYNQSVALLAVVILTILVFNVLLLITAHTISLTESKRNKAEGAYKELFENISSGIIIFQSQLAGEDFLILDLNNAAERIERVSRQEAIGRSAFQAIPLQLELGVPALLRKVLATDQSEFAQVSVTRENGERLWRDYRLYRLPPDMVVAIFNDITAQKRIEEESEHLRLQLLQSQKIEAIGHLAGGIAHDFNNFLTIIIGYSDLVLARTTCPADMRIDLEEVMRAARSASGLIQNLLAFSRKQLLKPEIVSVNQVIENARRMLCTMLGENIQFVFDKQEALQRIRVDPNQLVQVIMNLVANAKDAMANGGKLLIRTSDVHVDENAPSQHLGVRHGEYVMIEVSDTGEGMDEEVLSQVFEPFFTTKEVGKGTGLGLSTVYGIVKQSNGSIVPYSEPGKGTTFKILFPATNSKNGEKEASVPITASELNSGECILFAEDEPTLRAFAGRILAAAGYRVLTAVDGFHAMELASQQNWAIDLLITDMVMPGMSGKDLAQRLVQLRSNVKVLYVSGYSRDIVGRSEFASEAFAFLQKPFTAQTLLTKVHEVLGNVLTATVV